MKKFIKVIALLLILASGLSLEASASANTNNVIDDVLDNTEGSGFIDVDRIRNTKDGINPGNFLENASSATVPIMVTVLVLAGFLALIGIVFKPIFKFVYSMIGVLAVFVVLVNFSPEIVGIILGMIDKFFGTISA